MKTVITWILAILAYGCPVAFFIFFVRGILGHYGFPGRYGFFVEEHDPDK